MTLKDWICQRLDNCHTIAATKSGKDRDGWLEDAAHFAAVLEALAACEQRTVALKYGLDLYGYDGPDGPWPIPMRVEFDRLAREALGMKPR